MLGDFMIVDGRKVGAWVERGAQRGILVGDLVNMPFQEFLTRG